MYRYANNYLLFAFLLGLIFLLISSRYSLSAISIIIDFISFLLVIEGYLLCDEEFKLSKTKFSVTKTIGNIDDDGTIRFIDMYYLSDFFDFLRLEMMYALTNNVPIVKCGSCSKFFLADNPTMEYCDNEACRQHGAKKRSKETKQADAFLLLYDKVYQATYYKHKKCADEKQKKNYTLNSKCLRNIV